MNRMANTGYIPILTVHQNQNIELADKVTDQIDEMFRDVNVLITQNEVNQLITSLSMLIKVNDTSFYFPTILKFRNYDDDNPLRDKIKLSSRDIEYLSQIKVFYGEVFETLQTLKNHKCKFIKCTFEFPCTIRVSNWNFTASLKTSFFDKNNDYMLITSDLIDARIIRTDRVRITKHIEYTLQRLDDIDQRYGVWKSLSKLKKDISKDEKLLISVKNIVETLRVYENKFNCEPYSLQLSIDEFSTRGVNISFTYKKFIISKIRLENHIVDIEEFRDSIYEAWEIFKGRFLYLMENNIYSVFEELVNYLNKSANNLWTANIVVEPFMVYLHVEVKHNVLHDCIYDIKTQKPYLPWYEIDTQIQNISNEMTFHTDIPLISSDLLNPDGLSKITNTFLYQWKQPLPNTNWKQYVANELLNCIIEKINTSDEMPIRFIEKNTKESYE